MGALIAEGYSDDGHAMKIDFDIAKVTRPFVVSIQDDFEWTQGQVHGERRHHSVERVTKEDTTAARRQLVYVGPMVSSPSSTS